MITDSRGCQVKPRLDNWVSLLPIIFNSVPALTLSLIYFLRGFSKEFRLGGDRLAISRLHLIGVEHVDLFLLD